MKLAELAEVLDLPPRQVRYMIAEGILPGAAASGRYADGFGDVHVAIGRRYLELKAQGHSSFEVKRMMLTERRVPLYEGTALALMVDPNVDPASIDVEAVLEDFAAALRNYANPSQE